jgi:hypothetical protein
MRDNQRNSPVGAAAYFRQAPRSRLGAGGRVVMRECPGSGSGPVTVAVTREIG